MAKGGRASTIASVACTFCRKRKRKCDGGQPCSFCIKYGNAEHCEYLVDKDRRKWKYDSSFVDYLEVKSDLLENFANELTKLDPEKASKIRSDLKLKIPQQPPIAVDSMDPKLQHIVANPSAIEEVVSTAWRVREDKNGRTAFYGPISGRQQVLEDEEAESALYKDENGKYDIFLITPEFRERLFNIFEENFAKYYYISYLTLEDVRNWSFPTREPNKHFLLCAIFAYATSYTNMKKISASFLAEAESVALSACRNSLDEYVLEGLLVLSCFELGMAFDSSSWLFNAMCTSQTQYLGLHLGDNPSQVVSRNNAQTMVSTSPFRSATFWSVVMQDRLITSVLGRGSRIQYFRILASFYSPKIRDKSDPRYLPELVFTYHSRLWYIHDRSMGQIYSFKAQFLHKSHRFVLLKQGVASLDLWYNSLPDDIKLQNNPTDPRVLMLHLSFSVACLLLHRPYLSTSPEEVIKISTMQCINASKVVDAFNQLHGFQTAPYFASYLILLCAMFELFLLCKREDDLKPASRGRIDIFITALLEFGKVWRRGYKDIQVLDSLADKWGVEHYYLKRAAGIAKGADSNAIFNESGVPELFEGESVQVTADNFVQAFEGSFSPAVGDDFSTQFNDSSFFNMDFYTAGS